MAKSYIFDANKTTPAEVARRRKIAEALAGPYRPQNIGEGLSAIGAAFGSRIAANRASKAEQAGYAHAGEVMSPIFEGFFGGAAAPAPATADVGPASYTPPADADALTRGIAESANALGISPVDLATAISYETGGTFDPLKKGPTTQWGQHRGLIQFGEPQARQNGVDWNDPLNSQLGAEGAVVNYLRNAGVKPGMGLLDIYSAINAGAPGLYNRSDANNGGAPGTVRDKVEQQMAGHIARAQQMFGNNSEPVQVASAAPQSLRDGVRMAYARLDGGMPVPSPAGGAAAPVSAPPPQAPEPQVAQAQPQGGQPQPKLGQSLVGLPTLLKAAQDPWVAQNPLYSGIINQLISIELKARMPMSEAEKMDLDMKRLQLEKTALEIGQMRNPQMSPADQARIGLDREKFKFEQDQAGQTDDTTEYDLYVKQMEKIGQQPLNFLEYQQALRKAGTPNNYGSIPQGYELQETPQGARLVPIAGGPADTSQQDDAKLRNSANDAATLQQSINSLSEVMGSTDLPVFGTLSRPFALYSGSPAGKARSYLKQITSGVALDAMTRLKEASKQGATGFGALSERELEILVSKMGALDPDTTDPQIIKETLDNIQRVIDQVKKTVPPEKIKEWGLEALVGDSGGSDIPQEAADMLRANPETAEQFDQIFGAGSAAKILGGK